MVFMKVILSKIQGDEKRKEKDAKQSKKPAQKGYNRYDVNPETFYSNKNKGIEEFGIDMYGGSGASKKKAEPR